MKLGQVVTKAKLPNPKRHAFYKMQKPSYPQTESSLPNFRIGEIKIIPLKDEGTLFAIASFTLNDWFYFGGVGVHYDVVNKKYFLNFPKKKLKNGSEVALCHPLSRQVNDFIQDAIIAEWDRVNL